MNQMFTAPPQTHLLLRKAEVYSLLDQICQALELTAAQLEAARTSYEAVAEWLSGSDNPLLKWIDIYAHGSTGLGTTVKPIGREDFDVDLICKVLALELRTRISSRHLADDQQCQMRQRRRIGSRQEAAGIQTDESERLQGAL